MTELTAEPLDLDAWLLGASLAQASVEVLQKPSLLSDYADWVRRWNRAEHEDGAELAAGDRDPVAALRAEGENLLSALDASRTTWHVRQLEDSDIEAINAAHPEPDRPALFDEKPPKQVYSPTDAQARAYLKAYEAWTERRDRFNYEHRAEQETWAKQANEMLEDRGAEMIARATVRIEQAGRVIATSITAEQARTLSDRIGGPQVAKIVEAITELRTTAPEVPESAFLSQN